MDKLENFACELIKLIKSPSLTCLLERRELTCSLTFGRDLWLRRPGKPQAGWLFGMKLERVIKLLKSARRLHEFHSLTRTRNQTKPKPLHQAASAPVRQARLGLAGPGQAEFSRASESFHANATVL